MFNGRSRRVLTSEMLGTSVSTTGAAPSTVTSTPTRTRHGTEGSLAARLLKFGGMPLFYIDSQPLPGNFW
jgi:hypothetical protein